MMSTTPQPRLSRSPSWPPSTIRVVTDGPVERTAEVQSKPARKASFDEDSEDHPEDHFLSPVCEYEDWISESDDDDGEIEWDAGITDFALFDSDRKRAQETPEQLDNWWAGFVANQQSALQRAVERTRANNAPDTARPPLPIDDVPGLTPDSSPNLRDDLEVESSASGPSVPRYLTITVTPPPLGERSISGDDDLPLFLDTNQSRQRSPRRMRRPGLRHARTLSGKAHSWRRPSWRMYSVDEDAEAEWQEEMGSERERR